MQARRAGGPDALEHVPLRGGVAAHPRHRPGLRRRPVERRGHLRADPLDPDPRHVPDRVTRPARADRQVPARAPGRLGRRHLPVPARPGQGRHDQAVPAATPWAGGQRGAPPAAGACAGRDLRRDRLPRTGDALCGRGHRLRPGRGRPGPSPAGRPDPEGRAGTMDQVGGSRPRHRPGRRRLAVERAQPVRLLRVLQGTRSGVQRADLPLGMAEGQPAAGVHGRGADPRPRHVPAAADPRRRPPVRRRDPAAGRQRLGQGLPGRGRPRGRGAGAAGGATSDRAGRPW